MVAYRCVSGLGDGELPDAVTRARTQRKGGQDLAPAAEVGKDGYDAQFLTAIDWATQVNEEDRPQSIAKWRAAFSDGQNEGAARAIPSSASPSPASVATTLEQAAAANTARFGLMSNLEQFRII